MTTLSINVPDTLAERLATRARQQQVSLDDLVSSVLESHIAAARRGETLEERAGRGSWEKFDRVMAKVPGVPPLPGDELPE